MNYEEKTLEELLSLKEALLKQITIIQENCEGMDNVVNAKKVSDLNNEKHLYSEDTGLLLSTVIPKQSFDKYTVLYFIFTLTCKKNLPGFLCFVLFSAPPSKIASLTLHQRNISHCGIVDL